MNTSFYTASLGARTQQNKMNVVANNIANVNTNAYKTKTWSFQDLLYYDMRGLDSDGVNLSAGTGTRMSHTNTDFSEAGYVPGGEYSYAISGEGFFMLEDPISGELSYTRNGNFYMSLRDEEYYLATDGGKLVLNQIGDPIVMDEEGEAEDPGLYMFVNTDGMLSVGTNEFVPVEKNGQPMYNQEAQVVRGFLEQSNVNLAREMAATIEASRAYSFVLSMMQTADEVEQTINNLR